MRIDINLASHPYEDSRELWRYWGGGLALLAIVTVVLLFLAINGFVQAGRDRQQIAKLESQIENYDKDQTQAEAVLNQPQNRELREESHFLNQLFERKSFSWTRVFQDLEQVMPAHLHVLSIHPDTMTGNNVEIKVVVGGESQEQALDLVRKMENSQHFKQTRINSVKLATEQGSNTDRVQAEIEAAYTPWNQPQQMSGGMH